MEAPRHRQDEAVAHDAGQLVLHHTGDGAAARARCLEPVEQHVAAVVAHPLEDHVMEALEVLVEVVEQLAGLLLVLLARVAQLLPVQRRLDPDVVRAGQVVADGHVAEERVRQVRGPVAQRPGLHDHPRPRRQHVEHEGRTGDREQPRLDDDGLDLPALHRRQRAGHPQRDRQPAVVGEAREQGRVDVQVHLGVVGTDRGDLQPVDEVPDDLGPELLEEDPVLVGLLTQVLGVEVGRVEAEQVEQRRPGGGVEVVVLVARPRDLEAQDQLALDRLEALVGVPADRQVAADVRRGDPAEGVEPAAQPERYGGGERVAPAQRLVAGEPRHQHRDEQALLDVDDPLPHQQVPQHLEVLDGDRVAVVVVGHRLGRRRHPLALGDRAHHRRALAAYGGGALDGAVAQLVERVGRGLPGGVLPGVAVGAGEAAAHPEQPADGSDDGTDPEAAGESAGGGAGAAAAGLLECPRHDLADVAVAVDHRLQAVAGLPELVARGGLLALPVHHRQLLLLARCEREAVEQVAHGVAVGHPLLLEPQQVAVGDGHRLVDRGVVVPVDGVVRVQAAPARRPGHDRAQQALQVAVEREDRCVTDLVDRQPLGVAGE